jgi:hypothetical protein
VQLSSRSHVKASLAKLAYNFLDTVGLHFYYKRLKCQQFKIWEVVQRLDGKMMREREREREIIPLEAKYQVLKYIGKK